MKIQSINNHFKYNQNSVPFKAYIKPNANFHILYGHETCGLNAKLVKQLNELPNDCIEILQLNKLEASVADTTECIILNHTTKQTENINLENNWSPLNKLIKNIVELKDTRFFNYKMTPTEAQLYKVMTTGKPLDKFYADNIEKYYQ